MSVRAPMHSHDVCAFMLSFAHGADLLHLRRHIFIAPFISCVLGSVNFGSAIMLVQANMDADAKRRRKLGLRGLLHTGRCSMAGLAEIIGKIKATPSVLDGPSSKTTLKKLNAKLSEGVLQHRLALPSEDGDIVHLNTYDPVSLLSCMLKEAPALQHAYDRAFAKHPCSFQTPWDMVIIFDELAPGKKKLKAKKEEQARQRKAKEAEKAKKKALQQKKILEERASRKRKGQAESGLKKLGPVLQKFRTTLQNPAKTHLPPILGHQMDSLLATWEQVEKQLVDVTMDPANKDFSPQMGLDGKLNVSAISKAEVSLSQMFKPLTGAGMMR